MSKNPEIFDINPKNYDNFLEYFLNYIGKETGGIVNFSIEDLLDYLLTMKIKSVDLREILRSIYNKHHVHMANGVIYLLPINIDANDLETAQLFLQIAGSNDELVSVSGYAYTGSSVILHYVYSCIIPNNNNNNMLHSGAASQTIPVVHLPYLAGVLLKMRMKTIN